MCIAHCHSQEIEWQNTIGGSDEDRLHSIQQTADGGYILGGYSWSNISGDKTENCMGSADYWIVKTDAAGNIQWQNTIGGNDDDALYSIQQTADGGYILGGPSSSNISGDKTENSNGGWDYWIVKTDATGNIQWQNTIGGFSTDYLYSIQQTADGGYILGGHSFSNISGDKTENTVGGTGDCDYWIVKTDATGNIQWQNTIGGFSTDYLYSIQQTADGGYILGGSSSSNISGNKTENSNGLSDYWIIKTDAAGNIQWQNTIGGSVNDALYSIQQTTDGGYILGGYSRSSISGDKTENCMGDHDYWIVKTDALGNIQWQNTIGGSVNDALYSIQQTADGGYILGGYSWSNISGDKTENNIGNMDYWIVKTDSNGNIQWQNTIGGNGEDWLYSIQQTADGGYILGGFSQSNISGDKTENSMGVYDYWIVKLTDKYNSITGKCFIDANSNNVQDAGEQTVINKQVTEVNTGRFGFSGQNGQYSVVVLDSGSFSVMPPYLNYYNVVPATHSVNFSGIQLTDSLNDFAFQPAGMFNDLCIHLTPLGAFRAGFNASYLINYENAGTTTINNCSVIFIPDNDVTYVSSNTTPASVTPDSVVWNIGALAPFQSGSILVTVNVNVGTPIGTLINSGVRIEPVAGDANPACNYSYWEVFTTGSFDPNDIIVDKDTLLSTQFPNPPYLEYIIRFQNTGNDTAFNVKILNPIDTFKLQLNTLEFISSSHPMIANWIPWERNMEFKFDNILLPDSIVNEPMSHGFVRYRVKPKSNLVAGDIVNNFAAIYFDFNAPVVTNTAKTKVVLPTGVAAAGGSGSWHVNLYPNPAGNQFTIHLPTGQAGSSQFTIKEIVVFDLLGKIVLQSQPGTQNLPPSLHYGGQSEQGTATLNVSGLSQGVYIIEVKTGMEMVRGKFVKE